MAKNKESLLWLQLRKHVKKAHFTRVESSTVNGIPDVHCVMNCRVFWLELKSNDDKNCGLSKWQINWHIKYMNAGGKVFILNRPLKDDCLELLAVSRETRAPFLVSRSKGTTPSSFNRILGAASRAAGSQGYAPRS